MLEVTKVVLNPHRKVPHRTLSVCSIVLDDALRLNDIQLCEKEDGRYLILPSRQDVYRTIGVLNKGKDLVLPEANRGSETNDTVKQQNKKYEEFFHPLVKGLYDVMLTACSTAYDELNGSEETVWRPKKG